MKTPGEQLYTAHCWAIAKKNDADPFLIWDLLPSKEKEYFESFAEELRQRTSGVVAEYIDGSLDKAEIVSSGDALTMKIVISVPMTQEAHDRPGNSAPKFAAMQKLFAQGTHSIRISAVEDREVKSTLARKEPDGSIRPYLENEATW